MAKREKPLPRGFRVGDQVRLDIPGGASWGGEVVRDWGHGFAVVAVPGHGERCARWVHLKRVEVE